MDGISIYDGGDYWHFVTYGLSGIYEKETENAEISGYVMEFTFKMNSERGNDMGFFDKFKKAQKNENGFISIDVRPLIDWDQHNGSQPIIFEKQPEAFR